MPQGETPSGHSSRRGEAMSAPYTRWDANLGAYVHVATCLCDSCVTATPLEKVRRIIAEWDAGLGGEPHDVIERVRRAVAP